MLVSNAEYDYYPEYTEEEEIKKEPKKQPRKKKKVRTVNKRMYMAIAMIVFLTNLVVLHRYAKISEENIEISKLEHKVVELEQTKLDLEAKLEGLKSTTMVSEEAKNSLGMVYPEQDQIVYVAVDNNYDAEVADISFSEKLRSVLSNFSSLL